MLRAAVTNDAGNLTGTISSARFPGGVMPTNSVIFHAPASTFVWTDMPAAATLFNGNGRHTTKIDLANYTQARLVVTVAATVGASGANLELQYATTGPFTVGNYLAIGSSAVAVLLDSANSVTASAWINLVAGAKADVFIGIVGAGGDATIDPTIGHIEAQFR